MNTFKQHGFQKVSFSFFIITLFNSVSALADLAEEYTLLPLHALTDLSVVTSSRQEQKISDVSAAISVITSADIQRSGASSIPQLLRMVPGVDVYEVAGNEWAVGIRGAPGRLNSKVLILVDGQNMHNPFYSGTRWGSLLYSLDDIDRIEVIRGSAAVIWGMNAVNGVINIITKSAATVPNDIVVGVGDRQYFHLRMGDELSDDGSLYARVYVNSKWNGSQSAINNGKLGDYHSKSAGIRFDGYGVNGSKWELSTDVHKLQSGQGYVIPDLEDTVFSDDRSKGISIRFHSDFMMANEQSLQFNLAYVHNIDVIDNDGPYLVNSRQLLEVKRDTFDFNVQHSFNVYANNLKWGMNYRFHQDKLDKCALLCLTDNEDSEIFISGYIEDQFHFSSNNTMTIGLRSDYNEYTGWEQSYNLGISSIINSDNTIWAAYSSTKIIPNRLDTIENPTLGWRQQSVDSNMPSMTKVVLHNNQKYRSQALDSMELGLRTKWSGSLSSDVVFFYQNFQDLMSFKFKDYGLSSLPNYLTYYVENDHSGKVEMNGLETSVNWILSSQWQAKGSFTFNNAISEEGDTAAVELMIPEFYTSLGVFWTPSSNFNINAFVYYRSDTIKTSSSTAALTQYSYTTVDVNARWRLNKHMEFSVIGNNLTDDCPSKDGNLVDSGSFSVRVCETRSVVGQLRWTF